MRTFIQLDVQNLFFSAKDIQQRIDFLKIRNYFHSTGDDIVDIRAYMVRSDDSGRTEKFEGFLRAIGYTLSIKTAIVTFKPGGDRLYKGTDQDMAICIDCMRRINDFDKWVLMSGDGDFIDLCRYLKEMNKIVEVWSLPGTSFNKRFCDFVDSIHFLNDSFFYKDRTKTDKIEKLETPIDLDQIPDTTQEMGLT